MPQNILRKFISISTVLRLDGFLSFAFGLATALFQITIFKTAVDLKSAGVTGQGYSLMESALYHMSGYYMLVGAILMLMASVPETYKIRLCLVVGIHHLFLAIKGIYEANYAWVIGNPWYDIFIHFAFFAVYAGYLAFNSRSKTEART